MVCQNPCCPKTECQLDASNNTWECPTCGWKWQIATYEDVFFWAWEEYYDGMDGDHNQQPPSEGE